MHPLKAAREFYAAHQFEAAEAQLDRIAETDRRFAHAVSLRARSARARGDWSAAETASLKSIELAGEDPADLSILAESYQRQEKLAEACAAFERLISLVSQKAESRWAYRNLARCQTGLGRRTDAERTLRKAISHFHDADLRTDLAENLFQQKRWAEAGEIAEAALATDPSQIRARTLVNILKQDRTQAPLNQKWIPFPGRMASFADADEIIRSSVLRGYPHGERFIGPSTRFLALGSCFAGNLANHLSQAGREVFYEFVAEEVNSTYANLFFLQWVERGVENETGQLMEDAYGPDLRRRYQEAARDCDVFIFTLGLAPCFFHPDTDRFFFMNMTGVTQKYMLQNYRMRMTTIEENVNNLRQIIETIRRLCRHDPKIVLTVSPVPLAATAERESAVIADCISKSTLRMACEQVVTGNGAGSVHYWPSFEIVRWLGPYFTSMHGPVFGAEDGKTRHVSQWLIERIIALFQETYAVEA